MAAAQKPYLVPATKDGEPPRGVKVRSGGAPPEELTLGHLGLTTRVSGTVPPSILVQPYSPDQAVGIEEASVRTFRLERGRLTPVWHSGINQKERFVWTRIARPGVYVPIGLPRDRLLKTLLHQIARTRLLADDPEGEDVEAAARELLRPFLEPDDQLFEIRRALVMVEAQTAAGATPPEDVEMRHGGHFGTLPLPGGVPPEAFAKRLERLAGLGRGLPEERLFLSPERLDDGDLPWPARPGIGGTDDWGLGIPEGLLATQPLGERLPWLLSRDWWMYQHDEEHTGVASGTSQIRSTSASRLILQSRVPVDGPIISKPSIVRGKIYIGSGRRSGGSGGTLHKIDIATGAVEGRFPTSGLAFYSSFQGIGGSPAIVDGRAYFTAVHGAVYCVDVTTMTPNPPHPAPIWHTTLDAPDPAHKQPINSPNADSWSSPLVVNGRVYVGCGEGESPTTYGFVVCLDAATGDVVWVFCASKFRNRLAPGQDNEPNVIPASNAISNPLPAWATAAGFSIHPDPVTSNPNTTRATGCSIWSSCAYDSTLDRIYVGTGNSEYSGPGTAGTELPDQFYGSGLLALDAQTGEFRGFFQPEVSDSYFPGDGDIDVPGAPTVFDRDGTRAVAFGSKNGSFFVLDADTLEPLARRQMLPRFHGTGVPGDRGTPIPQVVPTGGHGENKWGIMGTPAVHAGRRRLFVGIGGYDGMSLDAGAGIDATRTPFLRAVEWENLQDAWPTATDAAGVTRYTTTRPPMYQTQEVGLSSPAVVNDLVFVSTNRSGLYAFRIDNGTAVWSAPSLPAGQFVLGPAVYGDYVVIGAGRDVYVFTLRARLVIERPPHELEVLREPPIGPVPGPPIGG